MAFLSKKSVTLAGHETSVALEDEFWVLLQAQAQARGQSLAQRVRDIDEARGRRPLASACRLTALAWAAEAADQARAFSSEVDAGSRKENAPK